MAGLSRLAIVWFLLASVVVTFDAWFVLTRPKDPKVSHPYADHPILSQWILYTKYDRRYDVNDDAFVVVQSYCNLAEVALQLLAVFLHVTKHRAAANKVALIVSVMTLYKTVMYGLMEHFEGGKYTNHNSMNDLLLMVALPSSFWIMVPLVIVGQSWRKLISHAHTALATKKHK